jgi:hypothetical protein
MPCVVDRRRERDRGGEEVEKGGDDVMVPALEEGVEMCGDVWNVVRTILTILRLFHHG